MKPLQTYIALFRGINVGGKNILPMKELKTLLQELGGQEVTTYIQTGNAIFRSQVEQPANLAILIDEAIHKRFGFIPQVQLLTLAEIEMAVAKNPFPEACGAGKTLHLFFLAKQATTPDLKKLAQLQRDNERFTLHKQIFYLYTPDGIGRSRLAASVEKSLGVTVTARNWNTVCKLLELAKQID